MSIYYNINLASGLQPLEEVYVANEKDLVSRLSFMKLQERQIKMEVLGTLNRNYSSIELPKDFMIGSFLYYFEDESLNKSKGDCWGDEGFFYKFDEFESVDIEKLQQTFNPFANRYDEIYQELSDLIDSNVSEGLVPIKIKKLFNTSDITISTEEEIGPYLLE